MRVLAKVQHWVPEAPEPHRCLKNTLPNVFELDTKRCKNSKAPENLPAPPKGFEASPKTLGNKVVSQSMGAGGGANTVTDADLNALIEAWAQLPDDTKAALLKLAGIKSKV